LTGFAGQSTEEFGQLLSQVEGSVHVTRTPVGLDQDSHSPRIPITVAPYFQSLPEAKTHLNLMISTSARVQSELFQLADARITHEDRTKLHPGLIFAITNSFSRAVVPSKALKAQIEQLTVAYEQWAPALESLWSFQDGSDHSSFQFATTLRLQHLVASSNLRHATSTHEKDCDGWYSPEHFASILDLVDRFLMVPAPYLQAGPQPPPTKQTDSFSLEPAVNPALALIALKCRSTGIRRRALDTLVTARRREGLGYSESMAWFISVAVNAEETAAQQMLLRSGLAVPENLIPHLVPEAARWLDMAVYAETSEVSRNVLTRFRHESDGKLEVREWKGRKEPIEFEEVVTRGEIFLTSNVVASIRR
jgi:hypothetical protein